MVGRSRDAEKVEHQTTQRGELGLEDLGYRNVGVDRVLRASPLNMSNRRGTVARHGPGLPAWPCL